MMKRSLYRDTVNGQLTGVCAGLANYFGTEVWFMRMVFVTIAVLGAFVLAVFIYIGLSLMLEKQPPHLYQAEQEKNRAQFKQAAWQQGQTAAEHIAAANVKLADIEARVRRLENYVTSNRFKTDRAFKDL